MTQALRRTVTGTLGRRQAMRWLVGRAGPVVLRLLLAGTFVVAATAKFLALRQFKMAVLPYAFLPEALARLTAIVLPLAEMAVAVGLLLRPKYRATAVVVMLVMLTVFTAVLTLDLARGVTAPCGCFLGEPHTESDRTFGIARNLVLMAMAALVLVESRRAKAGAAGGQAEHVE